jgi:IPT/TIG domain
MTRLLFSTLLVAAIGCSNELKVTEVDPPNGAFTGGEEVVIRGNGFQPGRGGVVVKFGRREATAVAVESGDKIKVMTPAGDKSSTVDISVVFDDGKAFMLKNGFHYVDTTQQRATMDKAFNAMGNTPPPPKK